MMKVWFSFWFWVAMAGRGEKKTQRTHTGIIRSKCVRLGGAICLWLDNYVIYSALGYHCSHVASELGCPICISTQCYCLLLDAGKKKKPIYLNMNSLFRFFALNFLRLYLSIQKAPLYLSSL
jgi:hypothetical protein